jgi:hypothetical protein
MMKLCDHRFPDLGPVHDASHAFHYSIYLGLSTEYYFLVALVVDNIDDDVL